MCARVCVASSVCLQPLLYKPLAAFMETNGLSQSVCGSWISLDLGGKGRGSCDMTAAGGRTRIGSSFTQTVTKKVCHSFPELWESLGDL